MNENSDVQNLCLEVFGAISAMVSHDLKNTLAIINENAGLLDDLALLAEENDGVATVRVRAVAAKIAQQVSRSNTIIKNLNRFAHSGDTPVARADAAGILELMAALTTRKAAGRNISVTVDCDRDIQVEASLFHLEALIYLLLINLYTTAAAGSTVVLKAEKDQGCLVLRCTAKIEEDDVDHFPGEGAKMLLEHLGGSCQCGAGLVVLTLPDGVTVLG